MFTQIKELREKRARLAEQAKEILTRAENEKRALTAEEDANFKKYHDEAETIAGEVRRYESQAALEASLAASTGTVAARSQEAETPENAAAPAVDAELAKRAFRNYIVHGRSGMTAEEVRALSVSTDTSGGYIVPDAFASTIEQARKNYGGMRRSRATVITTANGQDMYFPTGDDTSNTGEWLGENTAAAENEDPTFGQVVLRAYWASSKLVRVPLSLLMDSAFDLDAWLRQILTERIGRRTNNSFTVGDGINKPTGIVTMATVGKTAASATAVTVDELYDVKHSVDPDYRLQAQWMFNDSTLLAVKKLKDGDGRYLWQAGVAVGAPDRFDGDPLIINQDMPSMATGNKAVLYGDFSKYFIRDVQGVVVKRLEERFAESLQVGFLAFARHDGALIDAGTGPVKALRMA